MRWWDIESIHEIEVDLFRIDPWSVGQFWNELAGVPDTHDLFVAESFDALVGYAGLATAGDTSDVQVIAVAREAHGSGIGRRLLDLLLDKARERGSRTVMLDARAENAAAISLYESAGFVVIHRRVNYYAPGVDAVVMRLKLTEVS